MDNGLGIVVSNRTCQESGESEESEESGESEESRVTIYESVRILETSPQIPLVPVREETFVLFFVTLWGLDFGLSRSRSIQSTPTGLDCRTVGHK